MFHLELAIFKLLAPLVRPHLSGVAGSVGEYLAVYFDPPGLYERKNWKTPDRLSLRVPKSQPGPQLECRGTGP